jgi:hypothetical protein
MPEEVAKREFSGRYWEEASRRTGQLARELEVASALDGEAGGRGLKSRQTLASQQVIDEGRAGDEHKLSVREGDS